ncbi:MAG: trypsin-like peptidase domain-containing protein [Dermatophilaceae bacterium]
MTEPHTQVIDTTSTQHTPGFPPPRSAAGSSPPPYSSYPPPPVTATFPPPTSPPWTPPVPTATPGPGSPRGRRIADISVAALLAAGLASGGTYAVVRATTPATTARTPSAGSIPAVQAPVVQANGSTPDWAATAKAVGPSVVAITVASAQGEGQGSGVVIDTAGHILTNNHVAVGAGPSATITVTLSDGRTYPAKIAGTDPTTDLAVLTLQNPPSDLTPISFGDSDGLAVGQPVMAIGNPLGLAGTVTTGIVSALNRPVSTGSDSSARGSAGEPVVTNAIQTSAAINPGNSGGALVTANGQLIGINSSIASLGSSQSSTQSGNIGIGFAIPSNEAKAIAEQLIATGAAKHAYLGVSSADGTVTENGTQRAAALVRSVSANTPAATAGLQSGDAVVALDGKRVDSSLALVAAIREHDVGDTVTLTVVRGGSRRDISVTLTARPAG